MALSPLKWLLGVALAVYVIAGEDAEVPEDTLRHTNDTSALEDARSAYSEQAAMDMAYIVTASYCEKLEDWSCGEACSRVSPVQQARVLVEASTGVHVLVGHRNDACTVAFSGTISLAGWVYNTNGPKLVHKSGCYHEGKQCKVSWSFQAQYDSIRPQLQGAFKDLGCHTFDITGHSVGGAHAMLLAWDLASQGHGLRHLYTFGAPRVGDKVFASNFRTTLGNTFFFRVTRGDDFVVLIPFMVHGFVHAGVEAFYTHNVADGLHLCFDESQDQTCARSTAWRYTPNFLSCMNQIWCGHHLYMHTEKVGLMGKRSCTATATNAATTPILP